jgi:hypothetical protein
VEQSAYSDIALYQDQGKDRQNKHSRGFHGIRHSPTNCRIDESGVIPGTTFPAMAVLRIA